MSVPHSHISSRSRIVFLKEFREIFRDRRTLFSVVVSPLILTPIIFAVMGIFIGKQQDKMKTETYNIGIVNSSALPLINTQTKSFPNVKFTSIQASEAENRVKDKTYRAVLVVPPDANQRLKDGHTIAMDILLDEGNDTAMGVAANLRESFRLLGEKEVEGRLAAKNLPADYAMPFKVRDKPIAASGGKGLFILSMMLPYILTISTFSGAIYAAFDQVAGEKERGTLETLLVSPASRRDLVLGKFGAVMAVCMISGLLTVTGLAITFTVRIKAFEWLSQGGLRLSPSAAGVILLVMLPLSILFAGILLAVSTYARNQKEAQTYLAPLLMVIFLPAMASMMMTSDAGIGAALVPILNTSIIIKQSLNGSYNAVFIGVAVAASIVYAAASLVFVSRMFQKESVLMKA